MKIALAKPVLRTILLIVTLLPNFYCYGEALSFDDEDTVLEGDLETDKLFYNKDAFSDRGYSNTRSFFTLEALLGGATLKKIKFENGDTDSIRAGSGVYIAFGVAHLMFDKQMDIGIKAGYLFDIITAKADDGSESVMSFTRKPIAAFSHYWVGRHCFGGGLTVHLDPIFTSRETADNAKYHNAYGAYAEYLFHFTGTGSALGIKYLNIDYKNKKTNKVTDGSAWGITFSQLF
jgi:hypothetical protein